MQTRLGELGNNDEASHRSEGKQKECIGEKAARDVAAVEPSKQCPFSHVH
jgi:hypothetical protein